MREHLKNIVVVSVILLTAVFLFFLGNEGHPQDFFMFVLTLGYIPVLACLFLAILQRKKNEEQREFYAGIDLLIGFFSSFFAWEYCTLRSLSLGVLHDYSLLTLTESSIVLAGMSMVPYILYYFGLLFFSTIKK